jgi:3-methyladenine DNA glycosylase AlkD
MKNISGFYGIGKPVRAEIVKPYFPELKGLGGTELEEAARWCWKQPMREFQYFGMELLYRNRKLWDEGIIHLLEELVVTKSWWDTVDYIADKLVGNYFLTWKKEKKSYAAKWSAHENMWLNRTALLFQLKYKDKTDTELLFKLIRAHTHSNEFFIRKAIGWALRQYSYTDPEAVREFVNKTDLKPLSRKEAMKHIGG